MRIVSKTHDYLDGALRHSESGYDKTITFVRKQEEFILPHSKPKPVTPSFDFEFGVHKSVDFGVVGFCGNFYPYARLNESVYVDNQYSHNTNTFYYDDEELIGELHGTKIRWMSRTKNLDAIRVFWDSIPKYYSKFDLFRKCQCAYMDITNSDYYDDNPCYKVNSYPVLRDIGFPKVKGVEQAYQDVELFITNVLAPKDNPYIAPIPDKIKAQSKGFDEFSFRKMKTKRK